MKGKQFGSFVWVLAATLCAVPAFSQISNSPAPNTPGDPAPAAPAAPMSPKTCWPGKYGRTLEGNYACIFHDQYKIKPKAVTWIPPAGVHSFQVRAWGGGGASLWFWYHFQYAGAPAAFSGIMTVPAGARVEIAVAGSAGPGGLYAPQGGGYNAFGFNGGRGGFAGGYSYAGGGGAATVIKINSELALVAAGGGGPGFACNGIVAGNAQIAYVSQTGNAAMHGEGDPRARFGGGGGGGGIRPGVGGTMGNGSCASPSSNFAGSIGESYVNPRFFSNYAWQRQALPWRTIDAINEWYDRPTGVPGLVYISW